MTTLVEMPSGPQMDNTQSAGWGSEKDFLNPNELATSNDDVMYSVPARYEGQAGDAFGQLRGLASAPLSSSGHAREIAISPLNSACGSLYLPAKLILIADIGSGRDFRRTPYEW